MVRGAFRLKVMLLLLLLAGATAVGLLVVKRRNRHDTIGYDDPTRVRLPFFCPDLPEEYIGSFWGVCSDEVVVTIRPSNVYEYRIWGGDFGRHEVGHVRRVCGQYFALPLNSAQDSYTEGPSAETTITLEKDGIRLPRFGVGIVLVREKKPQGVVVPANLIGRYHPLWAKDYEEGGSGEVVSNHEFGDKESDLARYNPFGMLSMSVTPNGEVKLAENYGTGAILFRGMLTCLSGNAGEIRFYNGPAMVYVQECQARIQFDPDSTATVRFLRRHFDCEQRSSRSFRQREIVFKKRT